MVERVDNLLQRPSLRAMIHYINDDYTKTPTHRRSHLLLLIDDKQLARIVRASFSRIPRIHLHTHRHLIRCTHFSSTANSLHKLDGSHISIAHAQTSPSLRTLIDNDDQVPRTTQPTMAEAECCLTYFCTINSVHIHFLAAECRGAQAYHVYFGNNHSCRTIPTHATFIQSHVGSIHTGQGLRR